MSKGAIDQWKKVLGDILFTKELSGSLAFFISLTISLSFSFYIFPLSYISGKGSFFESGDSVQHLSGWFFFQRDSWHFPVLKTVLLEYPKGVNIAYTDSIPLAAIIFKFFHFLLPPQFNYFGIWAVFSILLQGLASTWVLRLLGERRLIPLISLSVFAITYPALTLRLLMQHSSLYAQGILLISLGIVIAGLKGVYSLRKSEFLFRVLMILALLVHPYFLAMVASIYLAYEGQLIYIKKKIWKYFFLDISKTFLLIIFVMFFMGYFGAGDPQTGGFGFYSMNLASLVCGGSILLPNCNIDATGGQYEGDNYLGLGVVILVLVTALHHRRWFLEIIKKYFILFVSMIFLGVYAIAQDIWLAHLEILSLPFPHFFITYIFRSNGRFFWPVGDAILIVSFFAFLRSRNQRFLLGWLVVIVFLQLADLHGILLNDKSFAGSKDPAFVARVSKWSPLLKNVSLVRLYPSFSCGAAPLQALFFQYLAAVNGKPFIGAYVAHGGIRPKCDKEAKIIPQANELDLFLVKQQNLPFFAQKELKDGQCRKFSQGIACMKASTSRWWEKNNGFAPNHT